MGPVFRTVGDTINPMMRSQLPAAIARVHANRRDRRSGEWNRYGGERDHERFPIPMPLPLSRRRFDAPDSASLHASTARGIAPCTTGASTDVSDDRD